MKTQTDPKVDYAFKHVFGREESKPALKSLLNAVLEPAEGAEITSLELLNPFNAKASDAAKTCIVDIKARDESGRKSRGTCCRARGGEGARGGSAD
jgi:predicted transposase/invertase (TIGR01784 family)